MIERCRDAFPVRMMCRLLKVSASGYYDWRDRRPSPRDQANEALLRLIQEQHDLSDGTMGAPRIRDELNYQGQVCGVNRVARLMRLEGLQGIPQKRRWRKKSPSARPGPVSNELKRDFTADHPNQKWVTDITYIPTAEGFLYLCIVKELFCGSIIGWSMGSRQTKEMVVQAVLMALWQRSSRDPVILHSDRGCQFTSGEYQRFLRGHNLICSMSAVGTCADNSSAESFFGQMKRERCNRKKYLTRSEARSDVFDYIERFYNPAKKRKLERQKSIQSNLTKLSVETG